MALVYPSGVTTDRDKWLCLMRTLELLRVAHNFIAQTMQEGGKLTPAYWNNLPRRFRVAVPANTALSFTDWPSFKALWLDVRQQVLDALVALPLPSEIATAGTPALRRAAKATLAVAAASVASTDLDAL